jgi:hypothetical protein
LRRGSLLRGSLRQRKAGASEKRQRHHACAKWMSHGTAPVGFGYVH